MTGYIQLHATCVVRAEDLLAITKTLLRSAREHDCIRIDLRASNPVFITPLEGETLDGIWDAACKALMPASDADLYRKAVARRALPPEQSEDWIT